MELRTGLAGLKATSTAASIWLRGMLALSTERENDEGSGNGNASVRKIDLDFCRHTWIRTCAVGGGSGALAAGAAGASGRQGSGADAGDGAGGGEAAHMQAGGAAVEGCGVSEGDGLECSGTVSQVSVYCPCILVDILRQGAEEGGDGMAAAWGT